MKNAKTLHIVQIVILFALAAAVTFAVVRFGRPAFAAQTDVTTRSQPETTSEAPQEDPSWLPVIEYDAYTPSGIDPENFRDTVVLGNSQAQAMSNFGLLRNADFVTRVGLSIHQVLTSSTGDPPIADLYGKQYRKAVFVFGENELGWPYPKNFIAQYKKVIDKVRELNPGIEIYCQAIFPVTASCDETSTTGITNANVRQFNGLIEEMCAQIGARFMPVSDAFFDADGVLPADAAKDGVHFGYDYCKIWAGDLSAYLQDDPAEETAIEETPETTEATTEGVLPE